jgi:hypothetical protein
LTEFLICFEGTGQAASTSTSAETTPVPKKIASSGESDIIFIEQSAKVLSEIQNQMNLASYYLFQQTILQNHSSDPRSKVTGVP